MSSFDSTTKDLESPTFTSESQLTVVTSTPYPNRWSRIRHTIREPAAEFLGTMVLVLIGTAGNAQGVLFSSTDVSSSPAGVSNILYFLICI